MRTTWATLVAAFVLPALGLPAAAAAPPAPAIEAACFAQANPPRPTTNLAQLESGGVYLCTENRTGLWITVCTDTAPNVLDWRELGCATTTAPGPAQRVEGIHRGCPTGPRVFMARSRVSGGNSRGEQANQTSTPVAMTCTAAGVTAGRPG